MYTEMQLLNLLLAQTGSVSLPYKAVLSCFLHFEVLCAMQYIKYKSIRATSCCI